jgi:4-carboxymuconolactone decarboxylase
MATRREVLGDDYVDAATEAATDFSRPFQEFITRAAWGEVWTRPGLDRRMRSALTLALLAAGGHHEELALHVRAAVRNGLSREEISEVLMHTAVYAGVPAANAAFKVAERTLDEIAQEGAG